MFFARTEPLRLSEARLQGLRLSLNTPVVSTEELAVGPARAAIASHEEPDGRPNVTIGMRSVKTGSVVLYSFEGDLREQTSLAVVIDAALSFAESMGFLFDEDEIEAGGNDAAGRALALWDELMGDGEPGPVGSASEAPREEELLLEDLAAEERADALPEVLPPDETDGLGFDVASGLELPGDSDAAAPTVPPGYVPQFEGDLGLDSPVEFEGALDASDFDSKPAYLGEDPPVGALDIAGPLPDPAPAAPPPPEGRETAPPEAPDGRETPPPEAAEAGAPEPPRLTKFRRPDDEPPSQPAEAPRPAALGRVRLVRRGRGADGSELPEPVLRLFGAF